MVIKMDLIKNVERVENMLYSICGCSKEEAKEVLMECIERNKKEMEETE